MSTDERDRVRDYEARAVAVLRHAENDLDHDPSRPLLAAVVWALLAIAEAIRTARP
jgi:hypothetical protein